MKFGHGLLLGLSLGFLAGVGMRGLMALALLFGLWSGSGTEDGTSPARAAASAPVLSAETAAAASEGAEAPGDGNVSAALPEKTPEEESSESASVPEETGNGEIAGETASGTEFAGAEDFAAWRDAAEAGDVAAQRQLGVYLAEGRVVPRNDTEAQRWLKEAARAGDTEARAVLERFGGWWNAGDDEWLALHEAARNGDALAQRRLGKRYLLGGRESFATWPDVQHWHQAGMLPLAEGYEARQAVRWLETGAKSGDAEALYWLAFCTAEGVGTAKNAAKAQKMLARAEKRGLAKAGEERARLLGTEGVLRERSARGDPAAQFELGKMLAERGDAEGIAVMRKLARSSRGMRAALWLEEHFAGRDRSQAAYWCHRAADLGDRAAQRRMVDYEPEHALSWWRKTYDNGGGQEAARAIGRCYEEGKGCARNLEEARRWYQRGGAPWDAARMEELAKRTRTYAR